MTDEHLLTAAKLREQIEGRIKSHQKYDRQTGVVADDGDRRSLKFASIAIDRDITETGLGSLVFDQNLSNRATEAISNGNGSVLSHLVGVTEQDLDASALTLPSRINEHLENNDAPAFLIGSGNPNTGKTNTALLIAELRRLFVPEVQIIANFDSSITDERVTSVRELLLALLKERTRPKAVIIDEGSTHFDARTYRREVAVQFTPLAKRFAKIGVDHCTIIGHTGKDIHPEVKRLATFPYWKEEKKIADFFSTWQADSDKPSDRLFSGSLEALESASASYDPDDSAPWNWDLMPELFALDLDWGEMRTELEAGRFEKEEQ